MKKSLKTGVATAALMLALGAPSANADVANLCGGVQGKAAAAGTTAIFAEAARLCIVNDGVTGFHIPANLVHATSAKIAGTAITAYASATDTYGASNCHFQLDGVELNTSILSPGNPNPTGFPASVVELIIGGFAGGACP